MFSFETEEGGQCGMTSTTSLFGSPHLSHDFELVDKNATGDFSLNPCFGDDNNDAEVSQPLGTSPAASCGSQESESSLTSVETVTSGYVSQPPTSHLPMATTMVMAPMRASMLSAMHPTAGFGMAPQMANMFAPMRCMAPSMAMPMAPPIMGRNPFVGMAPMTWPTMATMPRVAAFASHSSPFYSTVVDSFVNRFCANLVPAKTDVLWTEEDEATYTSNEELMDVTKLHKKLKKHAQLNKRRDEEQRRKLEHLKAVEALEKKKKQANALKMQLAENCLSADCCGDDAVDADATTDKRVPDTDALGIQVLGTDAVDTNALDIDALDTEVVDNDATNKLDADTHTADNFAVEKESAENYFAVDKESVASDATENIALGTALETEATDSCALENGGSEALENGGSESLEPTQKGTEALEYGGGQSLEPMQHDTEALEFRELSAASGPPPVAQSSACRKRRYDSAFGDELRVTGEVQSDACETKMDNAEYEAGCNFAPVKKRKLM